MLGGSIFKARGPLLFDLIKAELHSYIPMAKIVVPRYEPVVGALLLAFDHYTKVQIPEIFTNIDTTLPQHLKINREEESI